MSTEETSSQQNVLVVDDDDEIRDFLTRMVERLGFAAIEASSVPKALKVLSSQTVDLMLLDIYLKGATGLDLIKSLHRRRASVPTIVISGYISEPVAQQLVRYGVQGLVSKPFKRQRLEEEISNVLSGGPSFLERGEAPFGDAGNGTAPVFPETERRSAERIPMALPVKPAKSKDGSGYLHLVNLSATGMQTFGVHPELLTGAADRPVRFEIPAVANLTWLHAVRFGSSFVIGWEFDEVMEQYLAAIPQSDKRPKPETAPSRQNDRRSGRRIAMNQTIYARGPKKRKLDLRLVNIGSGGMQTYSDSLDVLQARKSAPTEKVVFDLPVEAWLTWMEPRGDEACLVGWEFEGGVEEGRQKVEGETAPAVVEMSNGVAAG